MSYQQIISYHLYPISRIFYLLLLKLHLKWSPLWKITLTLLEIMLTKVWGIRCSRRSSQEQFPYSDSWPHLLEVCWPAYAASHSQDTMTTWWLWISISKSASRILEGVTYYHSINGRRLEQINALYVDTLKGNAISGWHLRWWWLL